MTVKKTLQLKKCSASELAKSIHQAKALTEAGQVRVSLTLQLLHNAKTHARIHDINSAAESICIENKVIFIENDPSFTLSDGEVNEGFLAEDGMHLNNAGQNRLIWNLQVRSMHLKPMIVEIQYPTQATTSSSPD